MTSTERRYDIDWLRVIAIGLLLIYHIAIVFQPWGVLIGFIQNNDPIEFLWKPMSLLNIWRIPLLFYVSGMGVGFAIRKRNWKQLIGERTRRILIPFLFGMVFIVPLHILLWQKYYSQDLHYTIYPSHLWFLANIFLYVLLLTPLFIYLKRSKNGRAVKMLEKLYSNPLGILLVILPFILEAAIMNPEIYATFAMTWHGFLVGLLAFLFGFSFIISGDNFWLTVSKWRWISLLAAIILYSLRFAVFNLEAPNTLIAVESNFWIFASFGFANRYLNHPGKILSYLSRGAYPIYILHMIFIYLGSFIILPLGIPALFKFLLIILFTMAGCFIVYEFVIRRIKFIRPLFGLHYRATFKMMKIV